MGKDDDEDNITFNSIVIVESLRDDERKTGQILRDYINSLDDDDDTYAPVKATHISVKSTAEFVGLVHDLAAQANTLGVLPILHIEAHGNEVDGIYFEDDSNIEWGALCDLITPLNQATSFRLVVVVAACYGMSLINGVRLSKPAPCFAMIGPTDTINEPEVMGVFRDFYRAVLKTRDASKSIAAMRSHTLCAGSLNALTARFWFELLMSKYLQEEATLKAIRGYALRQYLAARSRDGVSISFGEWKRQFRRDIPDVVRRYFETFFMVNSPAERARYRSLLERIENQLAILQKS